MRPLRVCPPPRPPLRAQPQAAFKLREVPRPGGQGRLPGGSPGAPRFLSEAASGVSHPALSLRLGVWPPPVPGPQSPWAPHASRPPRKRKRVTLGLETLGSPHPRGGGPLDRSTTTQSPVRAAVQPCSSPRVPRRLPLEARPGQRAVLKPEVRADGARGGPEVLQQE